MAAHTQISLEEYLRTSFEPDRDYLDGELLERNVGKYTHGKVQRRLAALFDALGKKLPLYAGTELRMQLTPTRYRIADVAVFAGEEPSEEVPSRPPLITIEILSPDDRHSEVMSKLEDYRAWGVRHVWFVDPGRRKIQVYESGSLRVVPAFQVPEYHVEIPATEIFA